VALSWFQEIIGERLPTNSNILRNVLTFGFFLFVSCLNNKKSVSPFTALTYIQENSLQLGILIDTVEVSGLSDTNNYIEFRFDALCDSRYSIFIIGRISSDIKKSSSDECTTKVLYEALEGLKTCDIHHALRSRYSLKMIQDSTLYDLTWSGIAPTNFQIATKQLFTLKSMLNCKDKKCIGDYSDSLKLLCNSNTTKTTRH
jgi:hypothetical protein